MTTAASEDARPLSCYLHVPFCSARCDYCAFATWTDKADLIVDYVDAVITEIDRSKADGRLLACTTVFVGGGTPSLLPPDELARMISAVPLLHGAEVTVECNPESTTAELLATLRAVGVTRISLGVQSLVGHVLSGLGRESRLGAVEAAVGLIQEAGFPTYNVDLIYGGATERDEDWRATVEAVLGFDRPPPHISAYALTVEAGTPLARDETRHPDDDAQAARYEWLDARLLEAGYEWYEISNFSLPGHECRHNQLCWSQDDYLGFGCAAHSHLSGRRFSNVWNIDRYLERVRSGESPVASEEVLDAAGRAKEALELSLRTRRGVPLSAFSDDDLERLDGLICREGDVYSLSLRGRMLANEAILRLRSDPAPV